MVRSGCRLLVGTLSLLSCSIWAQQAEWQKKVQDLERRVQELETERRAQPAGLGKWFDRFKLSGNADVVYFTGDDNSIHDEGRFAVESARLFVDVDLARDLRVGKWNFGRAASFYLEWAMYRRTTFRNDFESLYVQLDGILGFESVNARLGRFVIPFGEEYQRMVERVPENPTLSRSAIGSYYWDEGFELFGKAVEEKVEWTLAVQDGDSDVGGFNRNTDVSLATMGKLAVRPTGWAYVSASGFRSGSLEDGSVVPPGSPHSTFGGDGTHMRPVGTGTAVATFQDGVAVADDPGQEIRFTAWEADAILKDATWGQIWLAYGQIDLDTDGPSIYKRLLRFGIAEGILELGALREELDKVYLAARFSVFGTLKNDEGFSIEASNAGSNLGFNTKRLYRKTVGIGARLNPNVTLKSEYTWDDFELVRGVTQALRDGADDRDYFGFGLTVGF